MTISKRILRSVVKFHLTEVDSITVNASSIGPVRNWRHDNL